jgi:hypothetical protein
VYDGWNLKGWPVKTIGFWSHRKSRTRKDGSKKNSIII